MGLRGESRINRRKAENLASGRPADGNNSASASGGSSRGGSDERRKVRIDYRNELTGEDGSAEVDTNDVSFKENA